MHDSKVHDFTEFNKKCISQVFSDTNQKSIHILSNITQLKCAWLKVLLYKKNMKSKLSNHHKPVQSQPTKERYQKDFDSVHIKKQKLARKKRRAANAEPIRPFYSWHSWHLKSCLKWCQFFYGANRRQIFSATFGMAFRNALLCRSNQEFPELRGVDAQWLK